MCKLILNYIWCHVTRFCKIVKYWNCQRINNARNFFYVSSFYLSFCGPWINLRWNGEKRFPIFTASPSNHWSEINIYFSDTSSAESNARNFFYVSSFYLSFCGPWINLRWNGEKRFPIFTASPSNHWSEINIYFSDTSSAESKSENLD